MDQTQLSATTDSPATKKNQLIGKNMINSDTSSMAVRWLQMSISSGVGIGRSLSSMYRDRAALNTCSGGTTSKCGSPGFKRNLLLIFTAAIIIINKHVDNIHH